MTALRTHHNGNSEGAKKTHFKPGNPGRPKGVANKITRDVKAAIVEAFEKAGGVEYLVTVAHEKPETFCALLGKIIPLQVGGADGTSGKLVIRWET